MSAHDDRQAETMERLVDVLERLADRLDRDDAPAPGAHRDIKPPKLRRQGQRRPPLPPIDDVTRQAGADALRSAGVQVAPAGRRPR